MATDLTKEILIQIRDDIQSVKKDIKSLSAGLAETDEAMQHGFAITNERLEQLNKVRVESDIRVATEMTAVRGALSDILDLLRGRPAKRG